MCINISEAYTASIVNVEVPKVKRKYECTSTYETTVL
jgi:hypothetical protein